VWAAEPGQHLLYEQQPAGVCVCVRVRVCARVCVRM